MPREKITLLSRLSKLERTRPKPEPQPPFDMTKLSTETVREIAAQDEQPELDLSKFSDAALKEMRDAYDQP